MRGAGPGAIDRRADIIGDARRALIVTAPISREPHRAFELDAEIARVVLQILEDRQIVLDRAGRLPRKM